MVFEYSTKAISSKIYSFQLIIKAMTPKVPSAIFIKLYYIFIANIIDYFYFFFPIKIQFQFPEFTFLLPFIPILLYLTFSSLTKKI